MADSSRDYRDRMCHVKREILEGLSNDYRTELDLYREERREKQRSSYSEYDQEMRERLNRALEYDPRRVKHEDNRDRSGSGRRNREEPQELSRSSRTELECERYGRERPTSRSSSIDPRSSTAHSRSSSVDPRSMDEAKRKKSRNHHKHRSHHNPESSRESRWDQDDERIEASRDAKRSKFYRNETQVAEVSPWPKATPPPPPRIKSEPTNDIQIVECSNNKMRTQKRRMAKKVAPGPFEIVDLDDPPPASTPAPIHLQASEAFTSNTVQRQREMCQISVIPPESLSLPPVRKFDTEYMVPEDNPEPAPTPQPHFYQTPAESVPHIYRPQAPQPEFQGQCQGQYERQPQMQYQGQPQMQYQGQPQVQIQGQLQGQAQMQYQGQPQVQIQGHPQMQYQGQPQVQIQGQPQGQFQGQPHGHLQGQYQEQYLPPQEPTMEEPQVQEECFEEFERKPFASFPSVQIAQVGQLQTPPPSHAKSQSYDIHAVCRSCGITFIHPCKYPPSGDPQAMFLEPGQLHKCKCSAIFLHPRNCKETAGKNFVPEKKENGLIKQVDRIHKYECHDCVFKFSVEQIRHTSHYFESVMRKDGTLREKAKKSGSRDLNPILKHSDEIARRRYSHDPPTVQKDYINARRRLICQCNQNCCIVYHECPPKPVNEQSDDDSC